MPQCCEKISPKPGISVYVQRALTGALFLLGDTMVASKLNHKNYSIKNGALIGFEVVEGADSTVVFPVREKPVSLTGEGGKQYVILSAVFDTGTEFPRHSDVVNNYVDALSRLMKEVSKR